MRAWHGEPLAAGPTLSLRDGRPGVEEMTDRHAAQSIAQIVGLALILSVFLFVTYQDINRFF